MLFKMMRHVRDLNAIRDDDIKYQETIRQITNSCNRLFDFMNDIDDQERKEFSLIDVGAGFGEGASSGQFPREPAEVRAKLFGRKPIRPQ